MFLADAPEAARAAGYSENSLRRLVSQTAVLTQRLVRRESRTPMVILHALILPVIFLLTVKVVLGDSITTLTGENGLYRSVPLVTLVGAITGSTAGVVGIMAERADGFLARLHALPLHRAADLSSRLTGEGIRLLMTSLVVLATGLILGFRFHLGAAKAVGWVAVPVLFGLAFSVLVITIALYWPKSVLVEAIQVFALVVTFFCTGLVPLEQYPDWVQPLVRYQPLSPAVDAMRGLSVGGPVQGPITWTVAWCVGTVLVCLGPLLIGYHRACTNR